MTLDEACQILNVKNERLTDDSTLTNMLKVRRQAKSLSYSLDVAWRGRYERYEPDP